MSYKTDIQNISNQISPDVVNLNAARKRGTPPTQAFSDFLTHSEQGDWAELLFFNALKNADIPFRAIRYGKSDKIIAGDPGFKAFYNNYQDELGLIGKRPDILLFKPEDVDNDLDEDISHHPQVQLNSIVPKAVAGFEVRSSAYLTGKFKPKKDRPFLSFTPKVEDLMVVLKWIGKFGVPHFYVQIFFDAVYIIPFKTILCLLKDSHIDQKGKKNKKIIGSINGQPAFVIEKNPKNQYKETIHIYLNMGLVLSCQLDYPELVGNKKELAGGRLLHYVSFDGGQTCIDSNVLLPLINNP